jgi:hypothetical protein
VEAEGLKVQGQPGLQDCLKKQQTNKKQCI